MRFRLGIALGLALVGVVGTLAALQGVGSGSTSPGGAIAVDCDGGLPGIQTACDYDPAQTFIVDIHVTKPPTGGYFAHQVKLRWEEPGVLDFLPAADDSTENLLPACTIAARGPEHVGPPENPAGKASFLYVCVPNPPLANGMTTTGAVLRFQFQCLPAAIGTSKLTLVPRLNDPQRTPPADDPEAGTIFLNASSMPIDPVLSGASIICDEVDDPTPTPSPSPSPTPEPDQNTIDSDGDGCSNAEELGSNEVLGGRRDRYNPHDFFDTPVLDRSVTVGDIAQLVARFGTMVGSLNYNAAYDRTLLGPDPWDLGPPNGSVTVQDMALIVAQFGHHCAGPV
jgi:hypothetical protein